MTADLQIIILARDEAELIDGCIRSLEPLDAPTLVLDSGSTDGTPQVAEALGATVVFREFDGFASQRNAAIEITDRDWVLFIDADERLTPELCEEIKETLAVAPGRVAGFWLPRRNIAFGRVLRGGGWWPDFQARLLRRGRARYDSERQVHEVVEFDGSTFTLNHPIVHLNYATRIEFMRKQHRYTRLDALKHIDPHHLPRRRRYIGGPVRELWRRIVTLGGYRDGLDGLFMATVLAVEELRATWLQRRRS